MGGALGPAARAVLLAAGWLAGLTLQLQQPVLRGAGSDAAL